MKCKNVVVVFTFLFLNVVTVFAQDNNICEKMKGAITSLPYKCIDSSSPLPKITPLPLLQNFIISENNMSSAFNSPAISTNVIVNNLMNDTLDHFTQSEVSLAKFGNTIIVGYNNNKFVS